jgi:hypothetical protein
MENIEKIFVRGRISREWRWKHMVVWRTSGESQAGCRPAIPIDELPQSVSGFQAFGPFVSPQLQCVDSVKTDLLMPHPDIKSQVNIDGDRISIIYGDDLCFVVIER